MEKQGIVKRQRGEEDRRQQIVSLTERGGAMEQEAYELIPAGMGKVLKKCPLKGDDYASLARQLDAMIESLSAK
jgi:DNA-binding MarR family transcriptional regulator